MVISGRLIVHAPVTLCSPLCLFCPTSSSPSCPCCWAAALAASASSCSWIEECMRQILGHVFEYIHTVDVASRTELLLGHVRLEYCAQLLEQDLLVVRRIVICDTYNNAIDPGNLLQIMEDY